MGFFTDWLNGAPEFRATSGLRNPADWMYDFGSGSATYSGERVNVNDAVGLGDVFAAVSLIGEAVGGLPFKTYRKLDDGDERVEIPQHRMYSILNEKPNPVTDRHRFWSTAMMHLLLHGNAYIEKERDLSGTVESLWLQDPASIVVEWDGRNKSFYRDTLGGRKRWTTETMLHIYGPSLNGVTGESPIGLCRQTFGTAIARAKFEGGFYKRGAKPAAWISHPGRLGQGVTRLAEQMAAYHGGVDVMHKVPVLEENAQLNTISMPLADMQFVESQQLSRQQFANIFHLPASYLNASTGDSLTYATIESNSIQFAQLSIAPWTGTIAGAVNADPTLFPQTVVYAEHVLEALLKADVKSRAEWWKTLKELNVVDAAYIASRENLPAPPPEPKPEPPPLPPAAEQNGNGNGTISAADLERLVTS
jgi:HK97 family phage portal protein